MGKKKGSKGSGSKKKGGAPSSAERKVWVEPQMTMGEAMTAFQLNVKRRSCEEFAKEVEEMKAINEARRGRNAKLKADQMVYIKELIRQVKEKDSEKAEVEIVGRDQVEEAFLEKQQAARDAEKEIDEMQGKIQELLAETERLRENVAERLEYKNVGQHEHQRQISRLQQMLIDWQEDVEQTSSDLEKSLKIAQQEISRQVEESVGSQKDTAVDLAMTNIDANAQSDVLDNESLHKELQMHNEDVARLRTWTDQLEESTVDMLQEMMEYSAEELQLAEKAYKPDSDSDSESCGSPAGRADDPWENDLFGNTSDAEGDEGTKGRLSPAERKELMIRGKGIPLATAKAESLKLKNESTESAAAVNPTKWPVTVHMLKTAVKDSTPKS